MAHYNPPPRSVTTCPMCLSEYDQDIYIPYVASCGHNVCEVCLGDIICNNTCPTCKEETFVMRKKNELALELMSQLEESHRVIEASKCLLDESSTPGRNPAQGGSSNVRNMATGFEELTLEEDEEHGPQTIIEVLNVSPDWKKPDLNARFGVFGKILKSYLPIFTDTQKTKGYAVITYERSESAQEAIFTQNDTPNDYGGKLEVRYQVRRSHTQAVIKRKQRGKWDPKTTIYITGLTNITEAQLREHFQDHGRIVELRLNRDPSGNLTGTAFIKYKFDHNAKQAIKNKNSSVLPGNGGKIYVDEYVPNMHTRAH